MITFSLTALVMLAQSTAWADGGTVQMRRDADGLLITVFASPSPLPVGPADISLLLQNRNTLEPVLDAKISLILRQDATAIEFVARPTREGARNKLLYAATAMFAEPGKWRLAITVSHQGKETKAAGVLNVAPAPSRIASYAGYIAFPPVMIVLVVIRERLIQRRSRRGE